MKKYKTENYFSNYFYEPARPEHVEGNERSNGSTQPSLFELWRASWAFTPELAEGSPQADYWNFRISFKLIIFFLLSWASLAKAEFSSPFVTETIEDLDIAINNYPERIKLGPEVSTILGNQITPGTLPRDFRINQQIYDDIAIVSGHIINIMRMVFDLAAKPTLIDNTRLAINQLLQLLTNLGIRYNITDDLSSIRTELTEIRDGLKDLLQQSDLNTFLMVPYNRLDVIKSEIVNLLTTRLVGFNTTPSI